MQSAIRKTFSIGILIAVMIFVSAWLGRSYLWSGAQADIKSSKYASAQTKLNLLANFGDSESQYLLGEMLARGMGVAKDDEMAIYWFRRAGRGKTDSMDPAAPAEFALSETYAQGIGVPRDEAESRKWLLRAAAGGHARAQVLAKQLEKNP